MVRVKVNVTDMQGVVLEQFEVVDQISTSENLLASRLRSRLDSATTLMVLDPGEHLGSEEAEERLK